MKHIKLFEDFNGDIYIEDAKYIIISHLGEVKDIEIDPKWNTKDLTLFELDENPTDYQISKCEEHLKEEGFFLNIDETNCVVGIGTLEEYCLKWLNTNYGDLNPVIKDDKTYYVNGDNKVFFYYYHDEKNGDCYIDYDSIWSFFENALDLEYVQIKEITKRWVEVTYNLIGLTPARFFLAISLCWN